MSLHLLGTWVRGLLSIAIVVAGVLLLRRWADDLPRTSTSADPGTGATVTRTLSAFGERLSAWEPRRDGGTGPLAGGVLLLLLAAGGGLLVSPWPWRRGGGPPQRAPFRVATVRTRNGYALHLEEHGEAGAARTVLLVHGAGCDRTMWRETIDGLAGQTRVVAFDLLGHGRSAHAGRAPHTLGAAAQDLDDVVEHVGGPDRLTLVGHSMGGMIAMTWVARHGQRAKRLDGLVLACTTPQDPFTTMAGAGFHRAIEKPVHEPLLRITPPLAWLVRLMDGMQYLNGMLHWQAELTAFGGRETRGQLDRVARLSAGMDPGAVARFTLSMMRFDVRRELARFDVPTLVVVGSKDPVTLPEAGHAIARAIPGARLATLQGTRHMGPIEQGRRLAEVILAMRGDEAYERAPASGARAGTGTPARAGRTSRPRAASTPRPSRRR